ncbi:MAG: hypothetical protein LBV36_07680 [Chromatiales bacterium]|jgi:hypothetical protein|nr:hypothetical protein [Chromatiales bacterium]
MNRTPWSSRARAVLLLGLSGLLAACGGGGDNGGSNGNGGGNNNGGGPNPAPVNQAPTVQITAPASNASFATTASISVTANASDADGSVASVRLFVDGSEHSTDTIAPYTFQVSPGLSAGSHTLGVVATDNQGATNEATVTVNVTAPANQAPTVAISAPANNASFTTTENISVTANASDTDGSVSWVELFLDDNAAAYATITSAPNSFTIAAGTLAAGSHTLKAIATDDKGAKGESQVTVTITAPPALSATVYLVGDEVDLGTNNRVVKYWKNGVPFELSNRNFSAEASSMVVSGSDVYVAGWERNTNTYTVATYWKPDGTAVTLGGPSAHSQATSIAVVGGDVYVAGWEAVGTGGRRVARYWKNDAAGVVSLTDGSRAAEAAAIAVSGSDVYVAGYEASAPTAGFPVIKYWKNGAGAAVTLTTAQTSANGVGSIAVSGSDVYVAGYEANVAKYWKNGAAGAIVLGDAGAISFAHDILVVDGAVYVAGEQRPNASGVHTAKVWREGEVTNLTTGEFDASATSIAVLGSDVYVLGVERLVSKYWVNGVATSATTASAGTSRVAIVVTGPGN